MYKFLCANIAKPRNVTNAYKKLVQTRKVHQDSSRPSSAPGQNRPAPEELQHEENQEYEDDNIPRPSTSPHLPRPPTIPPISLNKFQGGPSLKMKELPKFYTGHFIRVVPPTMSISKKYYHVYSFNGPLKRASPFQKKWNDQDRENYMSAMESLHNIERNKSDFQFKAMHGPSKAGAVGTEAFLKQFNKKKSQKVDSNSSIRYPTHTIKHTLNINRRYRIRQESAERRVKELEEQNRKRFHMKLFMPPPKVKKISYPTLVEHIRKGKFKIPMPERKYLAKEPPKVQQEPVKEERAVEQRQDSMERDFDALVKSHPTIENASKEVKMKLKTKFIQLLIKTARSPKYGPGRPENETKREDVAEQQEEAAPEKAVILPEEPNNLIVSHPKKWIKPPVTLEDSYHVIYRYPRRVYVDEPSKYEVEKMCIKESGKGGKAIVTIEEPPPSASASNQFTMEQFKALESKNTEALQQLTWGKDQAKIEQLKEERLLLLKELDKMKVKFNSMTAEKQSKPPPESEWREGNKEFTKEQAEKFKRILLGQFIAVRPNVEPKEEEELEEKWPWNNKKPQQAEKEVVREETSKQQEENVAEEVEAVEEKEEEERARQQEEETVVAEEEVKSALAEEEVKSSLAKEKNEKTENVNVNLENVMKYHASPGLEEKTKVDVLNETAREREEGFRKKKQKEDVEKRQKEIRERNEEKYSRKNYKPPRVDKIDDMMDEKVEIGEKVKEKIEKLIPERYKPSPAPLRKSGNAKESTPLDEKGEEGGYSISQPEPKKIAKRILRNRENEKKIERDHKMKANLEEFYQTKQQEWKRVVKGEEAGEVKCEGVAEAVDDITIPQEAPQIYNTSPDKTQDKKKKDDKGKQKEDKRGKKEGKLNEKAKKHQSKDRLDRERVKKNDVRIDRPLYPTGHVLDGPQDKPDPSQLASKPKVDSGDVAPDKSLVVLDQTVQENFPQIKKIDYAPDEDTVAEHFFQRYLEPAVLNAGVKGKMVINNIEEYEEPKANELVDAAVLHPGDEIVIYQAGNPTKPDANPDKQAECSQLTMTILDKASILRNELSQSESIVLLETKRQIEEMMEKIKNLEMMLRKQDSESLSEEKKSENKIRVPPPPPPQEKDKSKDSKKDKPKDKNAMILPPKVQGSQPEKSAKEVEEVNSLPQELQTPHGEISEQQHEESPDTAKQLNSVAQKQQDSKQPLPKSKLTFQDIINPQKSPLKCTSPKNDNQNTLLSKMTGSRLSKTLHSSVVNLERQKDTTSDSNWSKSLSKLDKVNDMLNNSRAKSKEAKVEEPAENKKLELAAPQVLNSATLFGSVKQAATKKLESSEFNVKARQYLKNCNMDCLGKPEVDVLEEAAAEEVDEEDLVPSRDYLAHPAEEEEDIGEKVRQYFLEKYAIGGNELNEAVELVKAAAAVENLTSPEAPEQLNKNQNETLEEEDPKELAQQENPEPIILKKEPPGKTDVENRVMQHSVVLQNFENRFGIPSQEFKEKQILNEKLEAAEDNNNLVDLDFTPDPLEKSEVINEDLMKNDGPSVDVLNEPFVEQENIHEKVRRYFEIKYKNHSAAPEQLKEDGVRSIEHHEAVEEDTKLRQYLSQLNKENDAHQHLEKDTVKSIKLNEKDPSAALEGENFNTKTSQNFQTKIKKLNTYDPLAALEQPNMRQYIQSKLNEQEVALAQDTEEVKSKTDLEVGEDVAKVSQCFQNKFKNLDKDAADVQAKVREYFKSVSEVRPPAKEILSKPSMEREDMEARMAQYFQKKLEEQKLNKSPETTADAKKKVIFSKNPNRDKKANENTLEASAKPKINLKGSKNTKMFCSASSGPRSVSCPGKAQAQAIQECKTQYSSWSTIKSIHQIPKTRDNKIFALDNMLEKVYFKRPASHTSQDKPPSNSDETAKNYLSDLSTQNRLAKEENAEVEEEDGQVVAITAKEEDVPKPTVFWSDKPEREEQKREAKVLELADEFQKTLKSIPKVYYPSKEKILQNKPIEMSPKKVIFNKQKTKRVLEMSPKRKASEADANLYQHESVGVVSFSLPVQEEAEMMRLSTDGMRSTAKVSKYASDSRLLSGLKEVNIRKNKNVSKAGISTTSALHDDNETPDSYKHHDKKPKHPQKEKSAIFRIMKDDEVLIIKKADEDEEEDPHKTKHKKAISNQNINNHNKTVDRLVEPLVTLKEDLAKVNVTTKKDLRTKIVASTGSTHHGYLGDVIIKSQKLADFIEVPQEADTVKLKQPKLEQIRPTLVAKVQEVIEKPLKQQAGTVPHDYKSELKLSNYHDDNFSLSYHGSISLPKACLKAKIETIYEKDVAPPQVETLRKFNRRLEPTTPATVEPLFTDLSGDNFKRIKMDFFEHGLKPINPSAPHKPLQTAPLPPPSIKPEVFLKKQPSKPKPETKKPPEQVILKSRSDSVVKTIRPTSSKSERIKKEPTKEQIMFKKEQVFSSYDNIKVEKNYSELLKKIEKNLRDKRKKLEVKEKIQKMELKGQEDSLKVNKPPAEVKVFNKQIKRETVTIDDSIKVINKKSAELKDAIDNSMKVIKSQAELLADNQKKLELIDDSVRINKSHAELLRKIEKRLLDKRNKSLEVKRVKPDKQPLLATADNAKTEKTYTDMLKRVENNLRDTQLERKRAASKKAESMYTLKAPKSSKNTSQSVANIKKTDPPIIWKKQIESLSKENLQGEIQSWAAGNNIIKTSTSKPKEEKQTEIGKTLKPVFVDAMRKHKILEASAPKYPVDKDDDFLSVDKTIKKRSQKEEEVGHQVPENESDLREQLVEEMRERLNKSKVEKHNVRQRRKSKTSVIKEMNEAAEHIIKRKDERQWKELYKGAKRQQMYQEDSKVSKPSVGIAAPWNKGPEPESDTDKKQFHTGKTTYCAPKPPSMDRLMSKDDFLKLKQKKTPKLVAEHFNKSYLPDEPIRPVTELGANFPVTISPKISMHDPTLLASTTKEASSKPKYTEMEIYKKDIETNKGAPKRVTIKSILDSTPLQIKFKPNKLDEKNEKVEEPKQIGALVESYLQEAPKKREKQVAKEVHKPPQMDPQVLNFKITKMVKMLAEDERFNEVKVTVDKGRETRTVKSVIPEKVVRKPKVVLVKPEPHTIISEPTTLMMKTNKQAKEDASDVKPKVEVLSEKPLESKVEPKESHFNQTSDLFTPPTKAPPAVSNLKPLHATTESNEIKTLETEKPLEPAEPEQSLSEKLASRLKTPQLNNMILHKPTFNSAKNSSDRKSSKKDEEAPKTNGANFILKPTRLNLLKTKNNKQKPSYQSHKSICKKFIANPKFAHTEIDAHMTTLDREIKQDWSVVPRRVIEIEERMRKGRKRKCVSDLRTPDPLDKYKHLKITYMTVNRRGQDVEKEVFMPGSSDMRKMEEKEIREQEKRKILAFRFNLLKKLNEEFKKQVTDQEQSEHLKKPPYVFDTAKLENVKTVKDDKHQNKNSNMNVAKQLGEAITKLPKSGSKKSGDVGKSGVGPLKRNDNEKDRNDKKDFSTDSKFCSNCESPKSSIHMYAPKHKESEDKTDAYSQIIHGKTDMYQTLFGKYKKYKEFVASESEKKPPEECKSEPETKSPESKSESEKKSQECPAESEKKPPECKSESEDFDITKAAPHAFAEPSPRLEEERQKDLYYRYHTMTFADLHTHLSPKRTFAKKPAQECSPECPKTSKDDV